MLGNRDLTLVAYVLGTRRSRRELIIARAFVGLGYPVDYLKVDPEM